MGMYVRLTPTADFKHLETLFPSFHNYLKKKLSPRAYKYDVFYSREHISPLGMYVRLSPTADFKHLKTSFPSFHNYLKKENCTHARTSTAWVLFLFLILAHKANQCFYVFGLREHIIWLNLLYTIITLNRLAVFQRLKIQVFDELAILFNQSPRQNAHITG